MQKITYRQAAELLGVQYITIRHAVMDGRLTRCVSNTKTAMLLREQVQLFKGKRGITEQVLNLEEKDLWEDYKRIAENSELLEKSSYISMTRNQLNQQLVDNYNAGSDDAIKKLAKYIVQELAPYLGETAVNPM